ncbi:enoyl-CoA hydratase/2-(1,2-epoxy-1,2-dihydrophenyl)acetyl-CoA isomerase [Actinacidiphila alni]|uniref:Enoyl-CoA hydratase/2-(1,2-epoxy-1,2-dihydrophenyl)acetyl-CoA isomerase n=1 Tax=Actinacidiphila alni TaxID=380248 RepID=A0A1I2JX01_9ACTN|nr:enoyl-CoA hydratase/isomerase family protein [Actinacidiphila alni]SFF58673.1 enoyl-CoA hydratase/2-(1,2-epoxy-1,2-dihydrophenyl)acetyl-CoA isomerase [Actinacidiphila alni]
MKYGTPESIAAAAGQVLYEVDETAGIAYLTLNRPEKHNAMSVPMRDRIIDLMAEAGDDARVRVIVIRGNGKSFCSGNEINEQWGQKRPHERRRTLTVGYRYGADMAWGRLGFSQAISRSPKVTVAQLHGYCAAAAYFMIACKADVVTAAEDTRIGALEARFLGPAGAVASVHINRILGMKAARRTGFTAMPMSGTEAHHLGLVDTVVPAADLAAATGEIASAIATRPPGHLLYLKSRLRAAEGVMDTSVPSITGLLVSHFLQSGPDEMDFWKTAKAVGVGGALDADKKRKGAADPRTGVTA